METSTRPLSRSERMLEALSTLAALLERTIIEVKLLEGDFQERLLQAVHDTESSLQNQAAINLEGALAEAGQTIRAEITSTLSGQFEADSARLNRELSLAMEACAQLESERSRLAAELDHRQENGRPEDRGPESGARPERRASAVALNDEISRCESKLKELVTLIDDPATELSTVMHKNRERSEVEFYLKGIRFGASAVRRQAE